MAKKSAKSVDMSLEDPNMEFEIGRVYEFQEAQGYFVGTVVAASPFKVKLGSDCVWIQTAGDNMEAFIEGTPTRWFPWPNRVFLVHALRHYGLSKFPSPASR